MLSYKGFIGRYEFSAGIFCGEVTNCDDVISFQAEVLSELLHAMQQAIDNYLYYRDLIY